MSTISVRSHFAAGHRILGLTGPGAKCASLHGHTFHVTWTFLQDPELEFGALKAILRTMVTELFDHGFVVGHGDELLHYLREHRLKHYVVYGQPTTEEIARQLAEHTIKAYPDGILVSVELQEGPDNVATWQRC